MSSEQPTLTGLPTELLWKICSFLPVDDLLAVGDTNKHLRTCVRGVIRLVDKDLDVMSSRYCYSSFEDPFSVTVQDFSLALGYIRIFGGNIRRIEFWCARMTVDKLRMLFSYVSRFSVRVERMHFRYTRLDLGRSLKWPMRSVKSLTFNKCHIGPNECQLGRWFPNLEELHFNFPLFDDPVNLFVRYNRLRVVTTMGCEHVSFVAMRRLNPNVMFLMFTHHGIPYGVPQN